MYEVEDFPTPPWRRRLLILVLALATAATVMLSMIYRPGGVKKAPLPPTPDAERCSQGRSTECVGGRAEVILLQPPPPQNMPTGPLSVVPALPAAQAAPPDASPAKR